MTFSTLPDTAVVHNVDLHQAPSRDGAIPQEPAPQLCPPRAASGDKAKARAILAAIHTLQVVEQAQRPPTSEERQILLRFPGWLMLDSGVLYTPDKDLST